MTNIGYYAFSACKGLDAIIVDDLNSHYSSVDGVLFSKDRTILRQCPGGKSGVYAVPNGVTRIESEAFFHCENLDRVIIPEGLTFISSYAFAYCSNLTNFALPDSVRIVGGSAFRSCSKLADLTISDGIHSIGDDAFFFCTNLSSVSIPGTITNLGDSVFELCSNLKQVLLPAGLPKIGNFMFRYCTNLANVSIPSGVTNVGVRAFEGCASLKGVYFHGDAPGAGASVFDGATNLFVYYLPHAIGWSVTWGGRPTRMWNPQVQVGDPSFGIRTNEFGFLVTGNDQLVVVVQAATNLVGDVWFPVLTNTITNGQFYFSDHRWTNDSSRFYRLRAP